MSSLTLSSVRHVQLQVQGNTSEVRESGGEGEKKERGGGGGEWHIGE